MWRLVDELRTAHRANLIDAVGELVAAILDMYARVGERHVPPVHICDARHSSALRDLFATRTRVDAERFEFAVQSRPLHPDESRGSRDVAAEAIYLIDAILLLQHFARIAQ